MKDRLIAFGRSSNSKKDTNGTADKLTTLSVSDLRRKLNEMGLDVDGSREAMIESSKAMRRIQMMTMMMSRRRQ